VSLNELVNTLPGVHPNDIARELSAIAGLVLTDQAVPLSRSADPHMIKLPVPHPLDFDWRFTSETINDLFRRVNEVDQTAGGVCFLGAPTLFRAAVERGMARPFYLVDASVVSAQALQEAQGRIFVSDLLTEPLPDLRAAVVVSDPPWYEEFVRAFLWAAAQLVEVGGSVLLSFPPVGTRPYIEDEWKRTQKFAEQLGLTLLEKSLCLKYVSPPFEQNALRAAHHQYVQRDWRPGVLVLFEKTGECREPRPASDVCYPRWSEQSLSGVRWRFRPQQQPIVCRPLLVEAVPGDILDSVSRRDPRRAKADVWTSGNRIFASPNTASLEWIAKALASGIRPDTYVSGVLQRKLSQAERRDVFLAAKDVATITAREQREYLGDWEE
jgi:hypothetical protein